jgi:hypothetical protein
VGRGGGRGETGYGAGGVAIIFPLGLILQRNLQLMSFVFQNEFSCLTNCLSYFSMFVSVIRFTPTDSRPGICTDSRGFCKFR